MITGRLYINAFNRIRPYKIVQIAFSSTDVMLWFNKFRDHYNSFQVFDFGPPFTMSDFDCYNLTGISKSNFKHTTELLCTSNIKNSTNRSMRNAIGLFLTKLRIGVSNKVLTTMFQFSDRKAISRTLASVREAMVSNFVSQFLGFSHILSQQVIRNHSSSLTSQLLCEDPNTVVLIIDGTCLVTGR